MAKALAEALGEEMPEPDDPEEVEMPGAQKMRWVRPATAARAW